MTKTLSGLQSGEFDDIDVFHTITINGEAGANNQVLTSDGDETSWKDVTIANNSVGTNQLADNAVTTDKLADNSLENRHLTDGAVDSLEIQDGAVIATKIGAGAVIATKIGAGAVTAGKIGAGAVTAGKIGAGAVTQDRLATDAVIAVKIKDLEVTNNKLAGSIDYAKLDAATIPAVPAITALTGLTNVESSLYSAPAILTDKGVESGCYLLVSNAIGTGTPTRQFVLYHGTNGFVKILLPPP